MRPVTPDDPTAKQRRVPQQSRSRHRVERILDAAAELVLEEGVDGLSTRQIAERADIPVASLYQYFADRDAIMLALVERDVERMVEAAAADQGALRTVTLAGLVEAWMAASVRTFRQRPGFVMVWLRGRTNLAVQAYGRAHNGRTAAALFDTATGLGLLSEAAAPLHTMVAVETGDRLFQLAFADDLEGDAAILSEAVLLVTGYLDRVASPAGRAGVRVV